MATQPDDGLVRWQRIDGADATPSDSGEWVAVIRDAVPARVRVVLTTNDEGDWWVSVADEPSVYVGAGPWRDERVDHRAAVTKALRAAGKRILD
jgi:hypothetical protein